MTDMLETIAQGILEELRTPEQAAIYRTGRTILVINTVSDHCMLITMDKIAVTIQTIRTPIHNSKLESEETIPYANPELVDTIQQRIDQKHQEWVKP